MLTVSSGIRPVEPSVGAERLLATFLAEAAARGLSTRTRDEYRRLVARFLATSSISDVGGLHEFVFGCGPSGIAPSPATARVRRAAMVSFFAFLVRRGHSDRNLATELPGVRSRPPSPRGLSIEEVRRLMAAVPDTPAGRRDQAIILTAIYTGLRRSELLGLEVADLAPGNPPTIRVRVKGGTYRLRELPAPVVDAILAIPATRARKAARTPLFAVSGSGFAANLGRYGQSAGLGHVTPHVLRHTAAKLRRTAGASLEEVSAFLGHGSIATTAIYLRRLEGWRDGGWPEVSRLLALPHSRFLLDVEARAGPKDEWPSERGNAHSAGWQGGPDNGTPLPTFYSSSRSGGDPAVPRLGATVTAPWRDERIGLLKSALQKYIRRGETDKVTAVAERLLRLPGGRSALARRLPVIAAEDVGIAYLPLAATDHGDWSDAALVTVSAGLSRVPKSKDAYWLAAITWSDPRPTGEVSREALQAFLFEGDHLDALRCVLNAKKSKGWRSGVRLIEIVREAADDAPRQAAAIVEAALRREAKGGFGADELIAAAVLAVIDRPAAVPPAFSPPTGREVPLVLDFYVADGHTAVGQRALRHVAAQHGMPTRLLAHLMFSYESIVLGPQELQSRWKAQAQHQEAVAAGWGDRADGALLWRLLRTEVARTIEAELQRVRL